MIRSTAHPPFLPPLSEQEIHKAVVSHIERRKLPGVFAFHPKNGGIHQRGRAAGINAGMGVIPGLPDLIIIHRASTYALELKTEKGQLSMAQVNVHGALRAAGVTVATAHGLDEAIEQLESWGLIRGQAQLAVRHGMVVRASA